MSDEVKTRLCPTCKGARYDAKASISSMSAVACDECGGRGEVLDTGEHDEQVQKDGSWRYEYDVAGKDGTPNEH